MLQDVDQGLFNSFTRTLRARNRSEQTIDSYRLAVTDLTRVIGPGVEEITKDQIRSYLTIRLADLSPTTVAIRFRSLRSFYNWMVSEEIIERSPLAGLTEPKVTDRMPRVLADEELKNLLAACSGKTFRDRRDAALIRLMCEPGGLRLGEVSGLQVEDLDMRRDLVVVTGKTGQRQVPFGQRTGTALERYLRGRKKHSQSAVQGLWVGQVGVLTPSAISQILARRGRAAGLGRINPHALRHAAAHAWLDAGGSESASMVLFGWKSSAMVRQYGRGVAVDRAIRAARRASLGDRL